VRGKSVTTNLDQITLFTSVAERHVFLQYRDNEKGKKLRYFDGVILKIRKLVHSLLLLFGMVAANCIVMGINAEIKLISYDHC